MITSGSWLILLSGAKPCSVVYTNICTDGSVASGSTSLLCRNTTNSAGTTANSNELIVTTPPVVLAFC